MTRCPQHGCCCMFSLIAFCFCLLVAHPAISEIYRWIDEQGNLHFTSDLNQVPSKYQNQTGVAGATGNIIVSGENDTRSSAERVEALKERSRRLKQQQPIPASRNKQQQPRVRDPGPEPRKYYYDCRKRTSNGRCRRHRTAAWNEWDALRQKQEAAEER